MKNTTIILFIIPLFYACRPDFDESEFNFNPYKKNDILIFESNLGKRDTLKIGRLIHLKNSAAQMTFFPDKLNTLIINAGNDGCCSILEMNKVNNEPATVLFDLDIKENRFESQFDIKIEDIVNQPKRKMKIGGIVYNDIIEIESRSEMNSSPETFKSKIYWSLKYGYVRYTTSKSEFWDLISKK